MKEIICCKNCTKRYLKCHDSCEEYIKQKNEYTIDREAFRKDISNLTVIDTYYKTTRGIRKRKRNRR